MGIDEFRIVLVGQPTPCFFTTEFVKSNFLPCQVVNDNKIVRNTSDRVEGKSGLNLFSALYLKLLVPTSFAISGYPWQWVETKWRWLATQDHAKLVYTKDQFEASNVTFANPPPPQPPKWILFVLPGFCELLRWALNKTNIGETVLCYQTHSYRK